MSGLFILALVLLFAFDQATKALVLAHLDERQAIVWRGVAIRRLVNRRGGGAVISDARRSLALWVAELLVIVALLQLGLFATEAVAQMALGAALGGAGGNVCDRLCRGGVIDFLDVGFWPVFNLGDAAIVIGAVIGISYL